MKGFKIALMFLLGGTLLFPSCLEEKRDIDYELLAKDVALADNYSSDAYKRVENEAKGSQSGDIGKTGVTTWVSSLDTCAIVTLDINGGNFPMTLTIDFGSGCTDSYGVNRKGKLIGVFSGRYTDAGTTVDVSFDNYYVNNHKVEGVKTIENSGRNGSSQLEFDVTDDLLITKPGNGGQVTWESSRTHTWITGESTALWICDDEYSITGTASGEASDGTPYGLRTAGGDPAKIRVCCPYIIDGTLIYEVDGDDVAEVDFGTQAISGFDCDAVVTATYLGRDYVLVLQ